MEKVETQSSLDSQSAERLAPNTVVVGVVVGLKQDGSPMVSYPGCSHEQGSVARTTIDCKAADIGRQVALLFEAGDITKPMVIGKIQVPGHLDAPEADAPEIDEQTGAPTTVQTVVDGETITLRADRELVLRCGRASITLTKAGKIILRGAYVLTRSSGVNKIKGASVQIN